MSTVLAIDPGLANGWAMWDDVGGFQAGETDFVGLMTAVEAWAMWNRDLRVVIESFTITQATARNAQAPWSLEVIGAVKWVCQREGLALPVKQSPTDAKSFVSNDKLRALGYWSKGGGGHHNDAARHLVLYRVNNGWREPLAL